MCKLLYGKCVCTGEKSTSFSERIIARADATPYNSMLIEPACIARYLTLTIGISMKGAIRANDADYMQ